MGYRLLPVSDLPTVDFPTIQVNASLPGASPETMASAVATPLEKQFSTIAGVTSISSSKHAGQHEHHAAVRSEPQHRRGRAGRAVDDRADASRQLPPEMPSPPSYQKVNPADSPVLFLTLSSTTLPLSQIDEYAENVLAQRLSMVSGVAQVNVFGAQKFAVRDRRRSDASSPRARSASTRSRRRSRTPTSNRPTGTLYGRDRNFVVAGERPADATPTAYGPIVVAYRNGSPVRLSEVAHVYDGVENDKTASWYNGDARRSTSRSSASPARTRSRSSTRSRRCCRSSQAQLPAAVQLDIRSDRSVSIRESVARRQVHAAADGRASSSLVIFLFLRNLSATIIPSLALPFSIVGTFAVMYLLGYSLDNLSLMALTLSVGFVVDDAIVMLENIVRHMEMGKRRMQAALDGSKEIAFTIVSMTLSLAAVFIPVLFMGGIVGRLMHEFAVTIGVGDSRVGPRVAHADADAVQPVPEAAARRPPRLAATT